MLKEIEVTDFGPIGHVFVRLSSGVTMLIGDNGNGKSMLTEAISWALYNTLIRSPRRLAEFNPIRETTSVSLVFADGTVVSRSAKQGLVLNGRRGTRDNNASVVSRFGSHRSFLTTRVFHRALLVKFSAGSDSERRAIIEELLDIDVFDKAHQAVREEIAELNKGYAKIVQRYATCKEGIRVYRLMLLQEREDVSDDIVCSDEDIARAREVLREAQFSWASCKKLLVDAEASNKALEGSAYEASKAVSLEKSRLQDARKALSKAEALVAKGICPTCGTNFAKSGCIHLEGVVKDAKKVIRKCRGKLEFYQESLVARQTKTDRASTERERLRVDETAARERVTAAQVAIAAVQERLRQKGVQERRKKEAEKLIEAHIVRSRKVLSSSTLDLLISDSKLRRLSYLANVFGNRGARVLLLTRTYKRLAKFSQDVATAIYGRNIAMEIFNTDNGDVTMSVAVDGAPFASYRSLSGGEQGVLDFAVLRAVGDISKIGNISPMPYIYDDILDAMDSGVASRVASYIVDGGRQSIVLTHDKDAVQLFDGAAVYDVVGGSFLKRGTK